MSVKKIIREWGGGGVEQGKTPPQRGRMAPH
jgi:hypothetical protein